MPAPSSDKAAELGPPGRDSQRIDRPHGEGHRRPPGAPRKRRARAAEAQARRRASDLPRPPSGIRPGSPPRSPSPRRRGCCRGRSAAMSRGNSGPGRLWRDDARHFDPHAAERRRGIAGGRLGGVRRALPVLWTTLDHQRRRRVLSLVGGHGSDRRGSGSIRARRGTRRHHGRDSTRVAGGGSDRNRATPFST